MHSVRYWLSNFILTNLEKNENWWTWYVYIKYKFNSRKVHIFWEGHKILRNLHRRFDRYYIGHWTNLRWRFCKNLWPSQNIWTSIPCKGSNMIKARGSRSAEIIWPPFMLLVATICLPFSSLNCTCWAIKYHINLKTKKKIKIQFA